ncbi:glycosyl transferase family 90-domain-containing protein [Mycena alexandri]|uniref:Glycosyl transferase family 90-domain-containing protein n=1 Tax=Mycena alexandri TaxID=1745969 RepID=A0AAD6T406_9AGAR|nr:glycosyl transferase family 90-domain-containing protein [Mycena alexandri]
MDALYSLLPSRVRSSTYTPGRVPSVSRAPNGSTSFHRSRGVSPLVRAVILVAVLGSFAFLVILVNTIPSLLTAGSLNITQMQKSCCPPPPPLEPWIPPPPMNHTGPRTAVDDLFDRQSITFEQAVAHYRLKNGRRPPRGYGAWYGLARTRRCLIDEYDQVHRNFEPFHQLAQKDKKFFKKMVERVKKLAGPAAPGLQVLTMESGVPSETEERSSLYNNNGAWMATLKNLGVSLLGLNLNAIINHREEPRVSFDVRVLVRDTSASASAEKALKADDPAPFRNAPRPTSEYFTDAGHCLVPNDPKGFTSPAVQLSSASVDFTTDLYPVLSQSKIYPCFADILVPSKVQPDPVSCENDPNEPPYWRGGLPSGRISGTNYPAFPRFRLLDLAHNLSRAYAVDESPIMDVGIIALDESFCHLDECYAAAIKTEYNIPVNDTSEREEAYKYLLNLDGNTSSGRFLELLKSGSLGFKSTLFTEYFSPWLRAFEHYIPVRPDLSDLVERIEWARANDNEARRIQAAGKEFADRVITPDQDDCYWAAVLVEWAGLQGT